MPWKLSYDLQRKVEEHTYGGHRQLPEEELCRRLAEIAKICGVKGGPLTPERAEDMLAEMDHNPRGEEECNRKYGIELLRDLRRERDAIRRVLDLDPIIASSASQRPIPGHVQEAHAAGSAHVQGERKDGPAAVLPAAVTPLPVQEPPVQSQQPRFYTRAAWRGWSGETIVAFCVKVAMAKRSHPHGAVRTACAEAKIPEWQYYAWRNKYEIDISARLSPLPVTEISVAAGDDNDAPPGNVTGTALSPQDPPTALQIHIAETTAQLLTDQPRCAPDSVSPLHAIADRPAHGLEVLHESLPQLEAAAQNVNNPILTGILEKFALLVRALSMQQAAYRQITHPAAVAPSTVAAPTGPIPSPSRNILQQQERG